MVEVDGEPLATVEQLLGRLRASDAGDRLDLTIRRGGESRQITVELVERESG